MARARRGIHPPVTIVTFTIFPRYELSKPFHLSSPPTLNANKRVYSPPRSLLRSCPPIHRCCPINFPSAPFGGYPLTIPKFMPAPCFRSRYLRVAPLPSPALTPSPLCPQENTRRAVFSGGRRVTCPERNDSPECNKIAEKKTIQRVVPFPRPPSPSRVTSMKISPASL